MFATKKKVVATIGRFFSATLIAMEHCVLVTFCLLFVAKMRKVHYVSLVDFVIVLT